ncbi:MAG: zf-HC2 domain-containing protein [Acidobacteria bacterium]|nr:zf-HC2 domain-containing protein [Acidobacteriota bacterium]
MKCKELVRELSEYFDGTTDPGLIAELERHLANCEDCRMIVDTTKKTIRLYCNSEPAPLDADVSARLQKALEARLGRRS